MTLLAPPNCSQYLRTSSYSAVRLVPFKKKKRSGRPAGRILNIPYDFRFPTTDRIQERFWNEKDDRIFTPLVFGAGWGLNLYQLLRKFQSDNNVEEEEIPAADFEL